MGDISIANDRVIVIERFALELLLNDRFSIDANNWKKLKQQLDNNKVIQWVKNVVLCV